MKEKRNRIINKYIYYKAWKWRDVSETRSKGRASKAKEKKNKIHTCVCTKMKNQCIRFVSLMSAYATIRKTFAAIESVASAVLWAMSVIVCV